MTRDEALARAREALFANDVYIPERSESSVTEVVADLLLAIERDSRAAALSEAAGDASETHAAQLFNGGLELLTWGQVANHLRVRARAVREGR